MDDIPQDLQDDINLLHDQKQWYNSLKPNSLVKHDTQKWTGKVIKTIGDPANNGKTLVEHEMDGITVQRFYSPLELSPVLQMTPPFRRAQNWLKSQIFAGNDNPLK